MCRKSSSCAGFTTKAPKELLTSAIFRYCQIMKYHHKKDNQFRELTMEPKRLEQTEESQAIFRMKELVKSVAPITASKIKKLMANRVQQVLTD